jgi:NTP pyrophosphatase (non-canonical NTP hydrolase)
VYADYNYILEDKMSKEQPTVGKIEQLTDRPPSITPIVYKVVAVYDYEKLKKQLDAATNELAYIKASVGAVGQQSASEAVDRMVQKYKYEHGDVRPTLNSDFIWIFNQLQSQANQTAKAKGWWDKPREDGTLIALCHAELSELLEYLRHGNPPSDHIPEFSGAEEEMADVLIRLMDLAAHHGWDIAGALVAKMEFNQGRAYKHGGKAF